MSHHSFVILGAGPSGLSLAHALLHQGVPRNQLVVVEQEKVAGGLCRSELMADGYPIDIGGGHFLDVRRKNVLDFLFRFMPLEEWASHDRVSKIRLHGRLIDYPLEANLWQLPKPDQVDYLESIARAGCVRGEPKPESFAAWITWKLGERIAQDYMLPYNRKIWSMDPDALGTYWLEKLPDVSFRETLRSCLEGAPFGTLPAHGRFYYPKKHGYGEVWRRMAEALGDSLVSGCRVENVDLEKRKVNGRWSADCIVTSIPWTAWPRLCALPAPVSEAIGSLRTTSIDIDYIPEPSLDEAHWIYEPDESVPHHRVLVRSSFCKGARGYWTETNSLRSKPTAGWRHRNEFAYPVNTLGKPQAMARILDWARPLGIVPLGRWGTWEHLNSDVAVEQALNTAIALTRKVGAAA